MLTLLGPGLTRSAVGVRSLEEKQAVMQAMQSYIDGVRLGNSSIMRSGFHDAAMIFGYYPGGVMTDPIQAAFRLDRPKRAVARPEDGLRSHRSSRDHRQRSA